MTPLPKILVGILAIALLVLPVAASTDTQFLSTEFMPFQYEALLVVIGFLSLAMMRYFTDLEVLFALLSTIVFGVAAWYAPYIAFVETFATVDSLGGISVLHTQLVTPQPLLQVILWACFLFSTIATAYVLFLRKADADLDTKSVPTRGR